MMYNNKPIETASLDPTNCNKRGIETACLMDAAGMLEALKSLHRAQTRAYIKEDDKDKRSHLEYCAMLTQIQIKRYERMLEGKKPAKNANK